MARFTGVLGLLTMLALGYLFSTNRRAIKLKTVAWGLGLQITFAFLVFYWTFGQRLFFRAGDAVNKLLAYAFEGSSFVFGELGKQHSSIGFIFAFQVLPTIIFIASLFALLYYLGVMQVIIRSAADHPPVPSGSDAVRTDDDHDQRHGARFGRNYGGVYRVRSRGATPAHGGHHDGAGHSAYLKNAGS